MNSAEIRAWYQEYERKLKADAERRLLVMQLQTKFGELPEDIVARIQTAGPPDLERWARRLVTTNTLAEVVGDS